MASTDDVLTAIKNIVLALNAANRVSNANYASYSTLAISSSTVVIPRAARLHTISVTTAGTTAGAVYDASTVALATSARVIAAVPSTVGKIDLNWPIANGIVYIPGSGQVASVSYT